MKDYHHSPKIRTPHIDNAQATRVPLTRLPKLESLLKPRVIRLDLERISKRRDGISIHAFVDIQLFDSWVIRGFLVEQDQSTNVCRVLLPNQRYRAGSPLIDFPEDVWELIQSAIRTHCLHSLSSRLTEGGAR